MRVGRVGSRSLHPAIDLRLGLTLRAGTSYTMPHAYTSVLRAILKIALGCYVPSYGNVLVYPMASRPFRNQALK
jgi:hypothetical protein